MVQLAKEMRAEGVPILEQGKAEEDSVLARIASLVKTLVADCSSQEAGLQEKACRELRHLARTSSEHKDLIGKLGGIDAVIKTMKANSKKGKRQAGPISTLEDIAARHAKNCEDLLNLGGVETVLEALEQHLKDPSVQ